MEFCQLVSLVIAAVMTSLYKDAKSSGLTEAIVDDLKHEMLVCLKSVPEILVATWKRLTDRSIGGFIYKQYSSGIEILISMGATLPVVAGISLFSI